MPKASSQQVAAACVELSGQPGEKTGGFGREHPGAGGYFGALDADA